MKNFLFFLITLVASTSLPVLISLKERPVDFSTNSLAVETSSEILPDALEAPKTQNIEPELKTTSVTFNDIATHWAKNAIEKLGAKGIVSGYADGRFGPDDPITRAQVLKIASNAFGLEMEFDPTIDPNTTVTRAEALKIILETAGFTNLKVEEENFVDVDPILNWYAKYSAFAKKAGLLAGYSDGTFHGDQVITRGEVCVIVEKTIDYLAGER